MGDDKRQDELGPDGMKKAKGYDEDTEGHLRLREVEPEGLKAKVFDEDAEGHMLLREDDQPQMEPEGLLRRATDDEDVDGHLRR